MLANPKWRTEQLYLEQRKPSRSISNRLEAKVNTDTLRLRLDRWRNWLKERRLQKMLSVMRTLNLLIQSKVELFPKNLFQQWRKEFTRPWIGELWPATKWSMFPASLLMVRTTMWTLPKLPTRLPARKLFKTRQNELAL